MNTLKTGISGVRGIYGDSLTDEIILNFACAFGTFSKKGRIVIGRDSRVSGQTIKALLTKGLLSTGCEVIDLDLCTTPTCQIMIEELKADGGVVVSASHNPGEWNGLKFFKSSGIYVNEKESVELFRIYNQKDFTKVPEEEIKPVIADTTADDKHIARVIANTDINIIKEKKFKVVLESVNGAGSIITPKFLAALGCETIQVNCVPDGKFPHNPEPLPENLYELEQKVSENGADVGFAQDPDADRLVIASEKGKIIGEEYSLCLAVKFMLRKTKGTIVTNLSTTRAVTDIANQYNSELIRTKVGEVNVSEKMKEIHAVMGGEGNGGVIDPRVHYGRDSLAGMAITLQYMAETGKTVSQLADEIPKYHICKNKITCSQENVEKVLFTIKKKYRNEKIDVRDGLKIDWADSWAHIRNSNTEPIMRIITESTTREKALELNNKLTAEIKLSL